MTTPTVPGDEPTAARPAPTSLGGLLRQLGPGLIISAIIVGSGELIVTPKLGAETGFRMLWFIILGCLVKVFVQIELGRYMVLRGVTTLAALDTIRGPRFRVSWLLWVWLAMYLCLVPQVAGMVGGAATALRLGGIEFPVAAMAVVIGGSCAVLLVVGRYRLVERVSLVLVGLFTGTTLIAVAALQRTPYAIGAGDLAEGLSFGLPPDLATAFGAFGVIGVGASELIYYPYWCLEKGYARNIGPDDGSPGWRERAAGWLRVMRIDAWMSFALYTTATVAFYLLGAAVLHAKELRVENQRMIEVLSVMYREVFGEWSLWVFIVGALAVLYSTIFGATASNARLFADGLGLFGVRRYADEAARARWIRIGCIVLPVAYTAVFLVFGNPVHLVLWGAVAQGLMLPFLAWASLAFARRIRHPGLRPGAGSLAGLVIAALLMTALGAHQVYGLLLR